MALAAVVIVVLTGYCHRAVDRRCYAGGEWWPACWQSESADHVQCAIKGHNYPDIANPPEKLRQKLGPQYAGLLEVVQQKLPGFEVLEAHVCSIPGSPRKYVHFITRGRGTILSVILTRRRREQLPQRKSVPKRYLRQRQFV